MLDEKGEPLAEAGPSRPVQVLGLTSVPGAGDTFLVVEEDRVARQIANTRQGASATRCWRSSAAGARWRTSSSRLSAARWPSSSSSSGGDVSGSVEALEDALVQLDVGEEVSLRVIHRGVGAITENDVTLASASDAVIIGFQRPA